MFSKALISHAKRLLLACQEKKIRIATAESCTGGLVAALLTEVPGSSAIFERGFVTYSNASKTELLGVPASLITRHGAVSAEVAVAMAIGALKHSKANLSIAITGIAGPGGGTAEKPVGLVYIATAHGKSKPYVVKCHFSGGRSRIRNAAVKKALSLIQQCAGLELRRR